MKEQQRELAETALRMARARRMRLDAKKVLNVRGPTDAERAQALSNLSAARKEWAKASAKLWRLASKLAALLLLTGCAACHQACF